MTDDDESEERGMGRLSRKERRKGERGKAEAKEARARKGARAREMAREKIDRATI